MRNIVSVDTTYDPIELSYTNCDCDDNTIQLEIFIDSSVSNPYLNVIKNDVTTVIDNLNIINNTIKYELDSSMFYSAGLLQVKVFNEDSNQIANVVFEQEEDYLATDNIIIKISNDTYVIRKVKVNEETTIEVIDNLKSTSVSDALSANQGRILNEKMIGVILYNNSSGSYETITLNDSIENYDFVEIYYIGKFEDSGDSYCYTKMYDPSGKRIELMSNTPKSNTNAINLHALITMSGTSLTWLKNYMTYVGNGGYTGATVNCIRIVKIIGYKVGD